MATTGTLGGYVSLVLLGCFVFSIRSQPAVSNFSSTKPQDTTDNLNSVENLESSFESRVDSNLTNCDSSFESMPASLPINGTISCHLEPQDPQLAVVVAKKISDGAKLLKYDLYFPLYDFDPLDMNESYIFRPNLWERVVGDHGKTLLSLAFNYDVLSLHMLTFGVEEMEIPLVDVPRFCFGQQNDATKYIIVQDLLLNDFKGNGKSLTSFKELDFVCQQFVVEVGEGRADFQYECCTRNEDTDFMVTCNKETEDKWISLLYGIIFSIKVLFLLLGPLVLQKWIYHRSIRKVDYVIKLSENLNKTLVVKKVKTYNKNEDAGSLVKPQKDFPGQFAKFRQIAKVLPSGALIPINISCLHIQVDHKELIDEKSVPTGLLYYIWTNFFQCGMMRYEPFLSCCRESIVGSWETRFLCFRLFQEGSACNRSCRKYLSWGQLTKALGVLTLMAAIALPFSLRILIYYKYEKPEIMARKEKIESVGLEETFGSNLFHYLTPSHWLMILMYICYLVSFFLLALYHSFFNAVFEEIVLLSVQDMRSISRLECGRLLLSHLLLPFEKFGLCGGMIVACVYWVFALPLCFLTIIWYCIPTLYLTGRLTIQSRPVFVKYSAVPYVPKYKKASSKNKWAIDTLSLGITSIESCMMLTNISPRTRDSTAPEDYNRLTCGDKCIANGFRSEFVKVMIGIVCVVWLYCILIMYAELFGFLVEAFVMIMMGAVVNAGSAANYVMMAFWGITYSIGCYNDAYQRYLNLNSKIFEFLKSKLKEDIKKLTNMRETKQRFTAFKYYTAEEIKTDAQNEVDADFDSEDELKAVVQPLRRQLSMKTAINEFEDSIEFMDGRLHWHVHHLILFIDKKDMPRIPRNLFEKICEINAPGCPGPAYHGLLQATRKFMYMVVFLGFVVICVMAFGSVYQVSSTNQMLVTLASGFVPFVLRFVLQPKRNDLNLNTFAFEGKVHEIIKAYTQTWPVHDLTFTLETEQEREARENAAANTSTIPSSDSHPEAGDAKAADTAPASTPATTVITTPPTASSAPITAVAATLAAAPPISTTAEKDKLNGDLSPAKPKLPRQIDLLITVRDENPEEPKSNIRSDPGSPASFPNPDPNAQPEDRPQDLSTVYTAQTAEETEGEDAVNPLLSETDLPFKDRYGSIVSIPMRALSRYSSVAFSQYGSSRPMDIPVPGRADLITPEEEACASVQMVMDVMQDGSANLRGAGSMLRLNSLESVHCRTPLSRSPSLMRRSPTLMRRREKDREANFDAKFEEEMAKMV